MKQTKVKGMHKLKGNSPFQHAPLLKQEPQSKPAERLFKEIPTPPAGGIPGVNKSFAVGTTETD